MRFLERFFMREEGKVEEMRGKMIQRGRQRHRRKPGGQLPKDQGLGIRIKVPGNKRK